MSAQDDGRRAGTARPRNTKGRERSRRGSAEPRQHSRTAPSRRTRRAGPARRVAFRVLRAVQQDDAYANLVLPAEIRRARLDRRDAGFATELTYGALRGQGTYDAIIAECADRAVDPPVQDALRLGAHQLLNMRVNAHAAVNETVGLVRSEVGAGPSGFVNAVLRRIGEKDLAGWLSILTDGMDQGSDEEHALRYAHPAWVVRALKQSLRLNGRDGELEDLLAADNAAPEVHLVGLPGTSGERHLMAAHQAGAEPSALLDGAGVFRGGDVGRLAGVREGELRVQDIGSQWIARAMTAPVTPEHVDPAGERWLDLCAGPGGKAALLAALAAEQDAHLTANEPAAHRSELVAKALTPLPADSYTIRTGDGRSVAREVASGQLQGPFDRILVDAPCTGLGALRRRPESRWRRQPSDLSALTALQEELLDAAVQALAPGGLLGYVTCSPHAAETVAQVEDLLRRHPEMELLDAQEAMAAVAEPAGAELLDASEDSPFVQLWPHVHGTDAMFFALLQKPA